MKTVYSDEKDVVLDENSVERKPCINRESKSLELTIKLYSCHNTNMKFLVGVTPPSIYQLLNTLRHLLISKGLRSNFIMSQENTKHFRNKQLSYNVI